MKYDDINIIKTTKERIVKLFLQKELSPANRHAKELMQKSIKSGIKKGKYNEIINLLTLGLCLDPENTFIIIRKTGVLRYSRYFGKKNIVFSLANDLLWVSKSINYTSKVNICYLESVVNLNSVPSYLSELHLAILKEVDSFKRSYPNYSLVKTLLAYVDYLFLTNYHPKDGIGDLTNIKSRVKEEISEAVSFLTYIISQYRQDIFKNNSFTCYHFVKSGQISYLITLGCLFQDIKEYEILIEWYDYQAVLRNEKIIIKHPNEDFEKLVRLGYIRTSLQHINDLVIDEDAMSMEQLAKDLIEREIIKYELKEDFGYSRYTLLIRDDILKELVNTLINKDLFYREEIVYLNHIFKEQLLTFESLTSVKIKDSLSLQEYLKIRRYFALFYFMYQAVFEKEDATVELILCSLIPTFSEDAMYETLAHVASDEKIDSYLDVTSWESTDTKFLDLQYHPIIYSNGYFMVATTTMFFSDTIRNSFASELKQGNTGLLLDGTNDPIVNELRTACQEADITYAEGIELNPGEIDFLCMIQNTLFVFECKHSLLPTGPHDMRTTYSYIKKAVHQLRKIEQLYENGLLQQKLANKGHNQLKNFDSLNCGIILSTRILCGNMFEYPTRNVHEFTNFITKGTMRTKHGRFLLWENDLITARDVSSYLSKDNKAMALWQESLSRRLLSNASFLPPIEAETYFLNLEVAQQKLDTFSQNLKKVEDHDQSI